MSIIVAGPPDISIKALNTAVSLVQAETSDEAILSTSFIPNADSGKPGRLRVSILGGKRSERETQLAKVANGNLQTERSSDAREDRIAASVEDEVNDLFGAPDWLVDNPGNKDQIPALL